MFVVSNEILHGKHSPIFPLQFISTIIGILHVYYLLDPTFVSHGNDFALIMKVSGKTIDLSKQLYTANFAMNLRSWTMNTILISLY